MIAAALLGAVVFVAPALAQEDDLNCGDPGTFHNMPIEIGNDPHGLDADNDGMGCEDPSVFGEPAPSEPAPTEPAPSEPATDATAAPVEPVVRRPSFTG